MPSNIYTPALSPDDWQRFLAEPEKQWKTGYSARATAHAWHAADGFPPEISTMFKESRFEEFQELETLLIIPEHKVYFPPVGGHPSQNDVFVLARTGQGALVSITVEAKVSESFDKTVTDWNPGESEGKLERLEFLRQKLDLVDQDIDGIRYQLIHRLVSAILEAERFNAAYAVMLVQSFSGEDEWFEDYAKFLRLYGVEVKITELHSLGLLSGIHVFSGWVRGDIGFLGV